MSEYTPPASCSVIIPARERPVLLERAIQSILDSAGSDRTEIIVIDDGSVPRLSPGNLRPQDRVIRHERSQGVSNARNAGIDAAQGELIYFLDSDDYFVKRDFTEDLAYIQGKSGIWFCDIESNGYTSDFPDVIKTSSFFEDIIHRYPFICQTSSLCFTASLGLRFDPQLNHHEDWDFLYRALTDEIPLSHIPGVVFFDRSDKSSLSRSYNPTSSLPWIARLEKDPTVSGHDFDVIKYRLLGKYNEYYTCRECLREGLRFWLDHRLSASIVLKTLAHRGLRRFYQFQKQVTSANGK